jgi:hypothetical protein
MAAKNVHFLTLVRQGLILSNLIDKWCLIMSSEIKSSIKPLMKVKMAALTFKFQNGRHKCVLWSIKSENTVISDKIVEFH